MPMAAVQVSPSGSAMPEEYEIYAERLHNFQVQEDDTWVISYPKCGQYTILHTSYTLNSPFRKSGFKPRAQSMTSAAVVFRIAH